jgi:hypothetical protein
MQRHLRCHGLPGEEVERLAGNILAITRHLRMARRTIYYHRHSGGKVGAGPQTFVDGAPVPGYASYDCLGMCGPRVADQGPCSLLNSIKVAGPLVHFNF